MARIGIFSGTFDPVHHGHIAFCRAALQHAHLQKIVLMPEAEPRGKQHVTPLAHRVAMLELATKDMPQLEVLQLQARQFDVQQTLPELLGLFPGDELVLLIGSDVVQTFAYRWPGLETLLGAMSLVIGVRQGDEQVGLQVIMQQLQASYPATSIRYEFIAADPYAHGASTRVRQAAQEASETIPHIADYIETHQLYKPMEAA